MAINVNVQYNGGFLPDIILLTLCYFFVLFVIIPFILDVRLHLAVNMWTHQPGSHRRKVTPFFFHSFFFSTFQLRCLP